ncbi:nucleotidyltransferase domain-containing protein [Candidatus Woesearchaeota archaeon]|nr:nucleotidyltransferase domain-containing protein [Candidatus Woesearchaeota archaeon]
MVQREFKDVVFEFAKEISDLPNVEYIFLFGSVAREEADRRSDIDICAIISDNDKKNISKIALDMEKKYNKNIQLVISRNFLKLDEYFIDKLMEEGILLFGKEPIIKLKNIRCLESLLISYSMKKLAHKDKMKIKTKLYGYSTKKKANKKVYKSSYSGLIKELNGQSVGAGAVLIPFKKAKYILKILDSFGAEYETIRLLKRMEGE